MSDLIKCACGCGNMFRPKVEGRMYIDRTHSNRRREKPKQTRNKHPKRCGKGVAGIAI